MRTLDRFSLGDILTSSEVAALHLATETLPSGTSRPVLLKVFSPVTKEDQSSEFRYAAEIKTLALIGLAPHLIPLLAAGNTDSVPWLAFPAATATAESQISDIPLNPGVVGRLVEEAATGLSAIHARGLLHNDLKPANLLITPASGCLLADLSLAAPPSADITQQHDMVRYAGPEVFSREFGKLSPSTDLYALGHIAYEMALGSRTWRAQFPHVFEAGSRPKDPVNPAKWMAWHCSTQTRPAAVHEIQKGFPPALGDVIARLIAKDPAQRFQSASEVLTALRTSAPAAPETPAKSPARSAPFAPTSSRSGGFHAQPPAAPTAETTDRKAPPPPPRAAAPATPTPTAPGGPMYLVRIRNKQTGPFDLATLQRHARAGLVSRLHQISTDGTTWRPATSIDGLFT